MRWHSLTPSITSKIRGIEIVIPAHAAKHGVEHAGGTMDGKSHAHQAVDHRLYLGSSAPSCITTNM